MNKIFCFIAIATLIVSSVGCANGPLRNLFRGSACNTCQPALQPSSGSQAIGTCTDGCNTPTTIPSPIFQPTAGNAGPIPAGNLGPITPAQVETSYYSANDPTTQTYQSPPLGGPIPSGAISGSASRPVNGSASRPIYGNLPFAQPNGGNAIGSGAVGNVLNNVLNPPTFNGLNAFGN